MGDLESVNDASNQACLQKLNRCVGTRVFLNQYAKETGDVIFFFQIHTQTLKTVDNICDNSLRAGKQKSVIDIYQANTSVRNK
jgi:hypothetical protein